MASQTTLTVIASWASLSENAISRQGGKKKTFISSRILFDF